MDEHSNEPASVATLACADRPEDGARRRSGGSRHATGSSSYLARLLWLFGPPRAGTTPEQVFLGLRKAFRAHGGLLRGDRIEERLHRRHGPGASLLARQVAAGELVGFEYGGALWLPSMQFDPVDMSPEPALARVAAELAGVFDGWDLCCWLAAPNTSLDGHAPMDVVENDPAAVLLAAREARFIVGG
jgi:hypothetical protein